MKRYTKNPSFWESESFLSNIDYTIVGGGMTGLIIALKIREKLPKATILVIERSFLASGASTKNAGFACFGSLTELISDLEHSSLEEILQLVEKRYLGLTSLRKLMQGHDIEYQANGGYEVFSKEDEAAYQECIDKLDFLNNEIEKRIGLREVFAAAEKEKSKNGLTNVEHLIFNRGEGQLNTGKLMFRLIEMAREKGIRLFNGIAVKDFQSETNKVSLQLENDWEFRTKKLIVANNAFAHGLLPNLNIKAVRNPVLITNELKGLKLKGCFHYKKGYVYFRNVDKRILIGGARHLDMKGETTSSFGINPLLEEYLIEMLKKYVLKGIPFQIEQKWSGILGVGDNKSPIVKQVKDNIFVAARMGGMGVAISSLVAEELVDLL